MPCYRINQFLVESDFPLPCPSVSVSDPLPPTLERLQVRRAERELTEFASVQWAGRRYGGEYLRAYEVSDGLLIGAGEEVRMLADRQGTALTFDFDPRNPFAFALARALAINLGVSLCALLRGDLPLHAAGAEINGKLFGMMAASGTGKSTLLWTLMERGARFANDDVIPVKLTESGVLGFPSVSLPAKLSEEGLARWGKNREDGEATFPDADEYWIPISPEQRLREARPLSALFVLQPFTGPELPDEFRVQQVGGGSALSLLLANVQGLWAARGLLETGKFLSQMQALAQSVPIYTLGYPRCLEVLPELARVVGELLCQNGVAGS